MRKIIKKIATVVATATMIAAMGITAFADEDSTYSFMGNPNIFGVEDEGDKTVGWVPTNEDQIMTAVDGMDGVYTYTGNCVVAGDKEYKVLKDSTDFAWNYQMCLGNPDAAWADNQSQFRSTFETGEYKVYVKPANGFVVVIQNQKALPTVVRYHSRDEDSANFVDTNKAAIEADGYSDVALDDAAYEAFIKECVEKEGGTYEPANSTDDNKKDDETVTTDDSKKDDTKDDAKAETTKKESKDDDKDGVSPVVIVVIVVVVVAVIIAIVALSKKKKN